MLTVPRPEEFRTPDAGHSMVSDRKSWRCEKSGAEYPLIDTIPWLVPDPAVSFAQLKNRVEFTLQRLRGSIQKLKTELEDGSLLESTAKRLEVLRSLQIRKENFLSDLLSPITSRRSAGLTMQALGLAASAPPLLNNYANIVRDWASLGRENELSFAAFSALLPPGRTYQRTLVLGAGACRFAYDFHNSGISKSTVCVDLNPVMLLSARRILDGNSLSVPELTFSPRDSASLGNVFTCRSPGPVKEGLQLVLADVYHLPVAAQSADAVITPWLIDILPYPLEALLRQITRVLPVGGQWLNTGSLNFQLENETRNYTIEEVHAVARCHGFDVSDVRHDRLPYLEFPMSRLGRSELVTSFRAEKVRDVQLSPPAAATTVNPDHVVELNEQMRNRVAIHGLQAQMLSWVDGKASLRQIAEKMSRQYGMPADQALAAAMHFFRT